MAKKAAGRKWKVPTARAEALERSENGITFLRPSKLAEEKVSGIIIEGSFLESMPNPFDNEKLDFKFISDENKTIILNGGGNLGYQMDGIEPGTTVQVSYNGKKPITKGKFKGREAHDFVVLELEIES
jgi:hypothetical protein